MDWPKMHPSRMQSVNLKFQAVMLSPEKVFISYNISLVPQKTIGVSYNIALSYIKTIAYFNPLCLTPLRCANLLLITLIVNWL
ncbi:hypothetical protein AHMF7616_04489 [Adhaeribacter pallidiroseus]|uniref:Uncharacterized protein n=1 Tax=Adhaeribacter pallidiroseus TaxID=2072847 RepID=A0A369QUK2_9BACT|nr:hypothetical protein AHMF7616_04489 [Adhaeribacter pallidiroseus]